jgi:diaminopimelate epimerase
MPGGELRVAIENGQAVLEGPVEHICAGSTTL